MKQILDDVWSFHMATDTPCLASPKFPSEDRVHLRRKLIAEEFKETMDAFDARDLVALADGLADLTYVIAGTALEFGIPLDLVWDEVQRSNMAKVDPVTGKAIKNEFGKVMKPKGWTTPKIEEVLGL